MYKILFVTTRNICMVSGESRLIRNRCRVLKEKYEIETDICSFISEENKINKSEMQEFASVNLVVHKKNFFDMISKYKEFEKVIDNALKNENYNAVILSGAFFSNIAKKIKNKRKNIYVVYDSHGAWDELKDFSKNILKWIKYFFYTRIEKRILKYSDGAMVISESLRKYLKKRYGWDKDTFIVPYATEEKEYSFEEAKMLRNKWRKELGIKEDEVLFVYSGGIAPHQSIDVAYDIFKCYIEEGGNAKFLITTPDIDKISYDDVIVKNFPQEIVSDVLFAGDIAMLIRDDFTTNKVAFPSKYLDYVKSNMFIISTPYISEISKEIIDTGVGMIIKNNSEFLGHLLKTKYENKETLWEDFESRQKIIDKYSFKKTLIPFVNKIKSLN